jgi:hypothetical protein
MILRMTIRAGVDVVETNVVAPVALMLYLHDSIVPVSYSRDRRLGGGTVEDSLHLTFAVAVVFCLSFLVFLL